MIAVFKRFANKRVRVGDNGVARKLTMAEAVIEQNVRAALGGDSIAMSNILRLAEQGGEFRDMTDPNQVGRPLFMPSKMDLEELMAFYGSNYVNGPSSHQTGVQSNL